MRVVLYHEYFERLKKNLEELGIDYVAVTDDNNGENTIVFTLENNGKDYEYILTEDGKRESRFFAHEVEAKQKEVVDAGLDTADNVETPTLKSIIEEVNDVGLNEDGYYDGNWPVTDNDYDLTISFCLGVELLLKKKGEPTVKEKLSDIRNLYYKWLCEMNEQAGWSGHECSIVYLNDIWKETVELCEKYDIRVLVKDGSVISYTNIVSKLDYVKLIDFIYDIKELDSTQKSEYNKDLDRIFEEKLRAMVDALAEYYEKETGADLDSDEARQDYLDSLSE